MYKYKPSKSDCADYAKKMQEIEVFCKENNIQQSFKGDSYYFEINKQNYRVSNHTIEASNDAAFNELGGEQMRELYHKEGRLADTIYIFASKTRLIEIYSNIKKGLEIDGRGHANKET